MAEIYAVDIEEAVTDSQYRRLFACAGAKRMARARRFRFEADAKRCIYAGALLNYVLCNRSICNYELYHNEYGKPYLRGEGAPYFNISHSGRWVICGVSGSEIGVDVEQKGRAERDVARHFFHPLEYDAFMGAASEEEAVELFYNIWTLKESYVKYLGVGIDTGASLFDPASHGLNVRQYDIDPQHKAAACTGDPHIGDIQHVSLKAIPGRLAGQVAAWG